MPKLCQFENCKKQANYGTEEEKKIFCREHKTDDTKNMYLMKCLFDGCKKRAVYGNEVKKNMYCKDHKTEDTVITWCKVCEHEECKVQSSFNFEGDKNPRFCSEHKVEGMIDVLHKKCEINGCKISPSFNFEGEKKGRLCFEHKLDGMVDVKLKKCAFENCKIVPSFNFEGEYAKYCSTHKEDGMVNVSHKLCRFLNCIKLPCFNFEGEKSPEFCSGHKLNGMIDVRNISVKKCFCNKTIGPSFNLKGMTPKYCSSCKTEGMINVKKSHSKLCNFFNCEKIPSFNFKGEKMPIFCSTHKLDGMVDVKNFKCACGNNCSFNFSGLKPRYCSSCRTPDMINVLDDKCKNSGCSTRANKKYKNYCAYCFQHLFPLDPLTFQIRCKTKELAVRDFINANYEGFNHDKILEYGGCNCLTRRRIDHRKLIGNTLLCIETDENQHKSYSKEDEEARYNDLLVIFTCKYIIIRFNPDSYVNKKGIKTNPYISARLEELKKEIDKQIKRIENNENAELLEVVRLYYDGYK